MATCGTQDNGKMYLCDSCPMDCSCSAIWRAKKQALPEGAKNTEQQVQPDNLPEDGDSDYYDDHGTGKQQVKQMFCGFLEI